MHVVSKATPRVCVELPHAELGAEVSSDDPRRYTIIDIDNGYSKGPLRAHLYDLGPSLGFRLVGIERPENGDAP